MRTLIEICEGLLDADFDIGDEVLSINVLCKRMKNDIYIKPSSVALKQLPKLINHMNIPRADKFEDDRYSWMREYPVAQAICHWICHQSKVWVEQYKVGEMYTAFYNKCLTDAGRKKSWKVLINPDRITRNGTTKEVGRYVTIELLCGSQWIPIVKVMIIF